MTKFQKLYDVLRCDIDIPINDLDAWKRYPEHRWIYDKLRLCYLQNIPAYPMPIDPSSVGVEYPLILKPIINLYGMGLNVAKISNQQDFENHWFENGIWCPFFEGDHVSWDLIVLNGEIQFFTALLGHKDSRQLGMFDYWESLLITSTFKIPKVINDLLESRISNYSGCINIETIGDKAIEAHLRMGDIDIFPTKQILLGIIRTYKNEIYDWTKAKNFVEQNKVFFFPVWTNLSERKRSFLRIFLQDEVGPLLKQNQNVHDFEIDSTSLASPKGFNRVMWFTTNSANMGKMIRQKIYKCIDIFMSTFDTEQTCRKIATDDVFINLQAP